MTTGRINQVASLERVLHVRKHVFRNTYSRTHYALSRTELPIHSGSAKLLAFLGIVRFTTSLIVNIFAQA